MSNRVMRTLRATICAGVLAGGLAFGGAASAGELSDKSVQTLLEYAWAMMPDKFTKPDGKVITIDKAKKQDAMIPLDDARVVIRVADRSSKAQVCKLLQKQLENHRMMMKREEESKKWSDQQLLFINQLHLFVVMLNTGNVEVVEKAGENEVKTSEGTEEGATGGAAKPTCTEEQKKAIETEIDAYVSGS